MISQQIKSILLHFLISCNGYLKIKYGVKKIGYYDLF
jgi:hypothetical protein